MDVNIGDEFYYNSSIDEAHSFGFMVFGINKENFDIIIDRDSDNPSLYKLKRSEISKCTKVNK